MGAQCQQEMQQAERPDGSYYKARPRNQTMKDIIRKRERFSSAVINVKPLCACLFPKLNLLTRVSFFLWSMCFHPVPRLRSVFVIRNVKGAQ